MEITKYYKYNTMPMRCVLYGNSITRIDAKETEGTATMSKIFNRANRCCVLCKETKEEEEKIVGIFRLWIDVN